METDDIAIKVVWKHQYILYKQQVLLLSPTTIPERVQLLLLFQRKIVQSKNKPKPPKISTLNKNKVRRLLFRPILYIASLSSCGHHESKGTKTRESYMQKLGDCLEFPFLYFYFTQDQNFYVIFCHLLWHIIYDYIILSHFGQFFPIRVLVFYANNASCLC